VTLTGTGVAHNLAVGLPQAVCANANSKLLLRQCERDAECTSTLSNSCCTARRLRDRSKRGLPIRTNTGTEYPRLWQVEGGVRARWNHTLATGQVHVKSQFQSPWKRTDNGHAHGVARRWHPEHPNYSVVRILDGE